MTGLPEIAAVMLLFGGGSIGWQENFDSAKWQRFPPDRDWRYDGGKIAVPNTQFRVQNGALVVEADRSSGSLMTMPHADLKKYPILHWRWRVHNLPPGADGRFAAKDDQAAVLYIGSGGVLKRKVLAFRWETLTPVGHEGKAVYAAGLVTVKHRCVRNHKSPINEYVDEYANVADLFQKTYGFLPGPEEYIISFGANSQYTQSHTVAEFDLIELISADGMPDVHKQEVKK